MKLDKEEHRAALLEFLTSQSITVPLAHVDAIVELREAVRNAEVEAEPDASTA